MSRKPTWTILLIDAHLMSRNTLKGQLEYYHYIVLSAAGARNAIQMFQQNQRTVDLVILDLKLKDAPCIKVLEILRKLSPELKIIAITDQSITENQPAFKGLTGLLRKPIRTDRLLALVGKALGRI